MLILSRLANLLDAQSGQSGAVEVDGFACLEKGASRMVFTAGGFPVEATDTSRDGETTRTRLPIGGV